MKLVDVPEMEHHASDGKGDIRIGENEHPTMYGTLWKMEKIDKKWF